jgi:uncharacterized protein (TIGR02611 family)
MKGTGMRDRAPKKGRRARCGLAWRDRSRCAIFSRDNFIMPSESYKLARRIVLAVVGFTLLAVGLVMSIPLVPGPGFLVIAAALAILAAEFVWARRLLKRFKKEGAKFGRRFGWSGRKKNSGDPKG